MSTLLVQGFYVLTQAMKSYQGQLVKEKKLLICVFLTFVIAYSARLAFSIWFAVVDKYEPPSRTVYIFYCCT